MLAAQGASGFYGHACHLAGVARLDAAPDCIIPFPSAPTQKHSRLGESMRGWVFGSKYCFYQGGTLFGKAIIE